MNEYVAMWKNYVNFSDRTTVRGYWMAFLINWAISLVLGILANAIHAVSFLPTIYSLATLIPGLAIAVRRLRDAGKAWGWIFIGLVPLVGWIVLIVFLCQSSTPDNPTGAATV